jgi:hypothetical protein
MLRRLGCWQPAPTLSAPVDDIESLATELSQKIWQKITILERFHS